MADYNFTLHNFSRYPPPPSSFVPPRDLFPELYELYELYDLTLPVDEYGPLLPFRITSFSEFNFFAFNSSSFTLFLLNSNYFFNFYISFVFFFMWFRTWFSYFSVSSPFFFAASSFSVTSKLQIFLCNLNNSFFKSVWFCSWSSILFFQSTSSKFAV